MSNSTQFSYYLTVLRPITWYDLSLYYSFSVHLEPLACSTAIRVLQRTLAHEFTAKCVRGNFILTSHQLADIIQKRAFFRKTVNLMLRH